MTRKEDPWRFPALARFGEQLRDAENEEHAKTGCPNRWRRLSAKAVALVGTLALLAGVLDLVAPAGASSPINHAPAAAAQSKSVRFNSTLEVTINGHPLTHLSERGALDFRTGDYSTTINPGLRGVRIERERIGSTLYFKQHLDGRRGERGSAIHLRNTGDGSSTGQRGYTLIDPQVVFRVLMGAQSPIALIGHEQLGGTQTTHYRLSTTLRAFLDAQAASSSDRGSYQSTGATLDVWLDGHGRPRRVDARFTGSSRFGDAVLTAAINFSRYGAPVLVRPPPGVGPSVSEADISPSLSADPIRLFERLFFLRR